MKNAMLCGCLCLGMAVSVARVQGAAADDHLLWNMIVSKYVDGDGRVAYRQLQTDDMPVLSKYLASLGEARIEGLPEKEQLAFWINAYNAVIVAGVLDGYSAESALKRYRFFKSYSRVIDGAARTPDDVEHGIIRPRFHDPRTHFALVCASTSCPKLRQEAYVGSRLDAQLDDQARRFLDDPSRNRIDPVSGTVTLSQIFKWFSDDFTRGGTLADVLAPYLTAEQVRLLQTKKPTYLDYDWTMNAQPGQRPDQGG
ncbi:MAG TPA: DUF547 domain-containing protein [Candidatus Margulisiibacteriota bacterium]|nr:DUF547 domain-containing protein [Candidatus Margulisiibacteriota bacterium]